MLCLAGGGAHTLCQVLVAVKRSAAQATMPSGRVSTANGRDLRGIRPGARHRSCQLTGNARHVLSLLPVERRRNARAPRHRASWGRTCHPQGVTNLTAAERPAIRPRATRRTIRRAFQGSGGTAHEQHTPLAWASAWASLVVSVWRRLRTANPRTDLHPQIPIEHLDRSHGGHVMWH